MKHFPPLRVGTALWLGVVGAGCSLSPAPRPPAAVYDLGAAPMATPAEGPALDELIVVHDPTAAAWVGGRQMRYRLAYEDPARVRRFANSQWAVSPVSVVGERLRAHLATVTRRGGAVPDYGLVADHWVRISVETLEQVFDTPSSSRAVVQFRVAVFGGRERAFLAQRTFSREVPAATPNARGGVEALGQAIDEAAADATRWIVDVVRTGAQEEVEKEGTGGQAATP